MPDRLEGFADKTPGDEPPHTIVLARELCQVAAQLEGISMFPSDSDRIAMANSLLTNATAISRVALRLLEQQQQYTVTLSPVLARLYSILIGQIGIPRTREDLAKQLYGTGHPEKADPGGAVQHNILYLKGRVKSSGFAEEWMGPDSMEDIPYFLCPRSPF